MKISDTLIQDIVEKIDFRIIGENEPGSLFDSANIKDPLGFKSLDVANTQIWDRATPVFNLKYLETPRMSTIANGYIINRLVQNMPDSLVYLNIGTWCGFSFFSGIIGNPNKRCIGVGNFSFGGAVGSGDNPKVKKIFDFQYQLFKTDKSLFFDLDYEEYFKNTHKDSIGVYFYDGEHTYEHQMKGLLVADRFIAPGGYVIVDDTNMPDPRNATLDFIQKMQGSYSLVFDVETPNNGHPTFWNGLMILRKDN